MDIDRGSVGDHSAGGGGGGMVEVWKGMLVIGSKELKGCERRMMCLLSEYLVVVVVVEVVVVNFIPFLPLRPSVHCVSRGRGERRVKGTSGEAKNLSS